MAFKNKTFIITGAGGGMGKATVQLLLEAGANVVGCDINTNELSGFSKDGRFLSFQVDLLDETKVKEVFKESAAHFGEINGLANIAGIAQSAAAIEEVKLDTWHKIMDINMTMTFLTSREAAIYMKRQEQGCIVNVGSVSVTRPRPGLQSYVASKGALEAFSKALALELAPDNINVNVLHPGPSETNMLGQFTKKGADVGNTKKEIFEKSVPLGRLLQPLDIAKSIKYLLSSEAEMITGSILHVDGGRGI